MAVTRGGERRQLDEDSLAKTCRLLGEAAIAASSGRAREMAQNGLWSQMVEEGDCRDRPHADRRARARKM